MGMTPTVENAATQFNAKTVTQHLDVVARQAAARLTLAQSRAQLCGFITQTS